MTFQIDGMRDLSTADHNARNRSFTIKNIFLAEVPVNEYFYVKVRGFWKNTKNQYDQVSFHLIYAFRVISKLVVT
jgi:hypothetical protein